MRKKGIKRLLALCLALCICLPTTVLAQEADFPESEYAQENVTVQVPPLYEPASEGEMSDLYEEVLRVDESQEYISNNMERPYDGKEYTVTNVPGGPVAYATEENTDPNNAYLAVNGNTVQGTLTQTGEMSWYGFILNQTSKISILVQTLEDVDADLYVFKLDQASYELNLIGGSVTAGAGVQEYCTGIIDEGIYYFAITAYEGSGAYAFAYYASQDLNYEPNDSLDTAAEVDANSTVTGIIDSPFDTDIYKITLNSPVVMRITVDVGDYKYDVLAIDENARMFKISQKEDLYRLEAGTHYFRVQSRDYTYDIDRTYSIKFDKIANVSADPKATVYMVNEPTKIVFQCSVAGDHMYVNGNEIDIYYYYTRDRSTSQGSRRYSISMLNVDSLRAVIYEKDMIALNEDLAKKYLPTHAIPTPIGNAQIQMPTSVFYRGGSAGTGETELHVLQLSLVSDQEDDECFYRFNCYCTGAFIDEYLCTNLNWGTVFINPNTGKAIDIYYFNYLYDLIGGTANKLSFLSTHMTKSRYLYPYYDGKDPEEW